MKNDIFASYSEILFEICMNMEEDVYDLSYKLLYNLVENI